MATRNLTAVEGLRSLLFLGVFLFHCVSGWFPIGWGGVEAFLVIGAYFLTSKQLKLERQNIKIGYSFWHRIKRLYPVYLTLLVIFTALYVVTKRHLTAEPIWYFFSFQNFRCLFESATYHLDGFLGHFWYVGLDVWLFLIWVVLMRLVPRERLRVAFISTLIIGLLWRTSFILLRPDNISLSYMIPIGQLDCWSIGGLLALNVHEKGNNNRVMWAELVLGLAGMIAIIAYNANAHSVSFSEGYRLYKSAEGYMDNPITGNIHFFIALLSVGLLRYCIDTTKKHPVLSTAPLVALGGMTYELYCFHYPIRAFVKIVIHNQILMVVTALLITLIVSWIWCKWVTPQINKVIK